MNEFTLICSVLAAISTCCAIFSFFINRKKDARQDGEDATWIRANLQYVRSGIDDVRLDLKELTRNQNSMSEKQARMEEKLNNLDARVKIIEDHFE